MGDQIHTVIYHQDEIVFDDRIPYYDSFGKAPRHSVMIYNNEINKMGLAEVMGNLCKDYGRRSFIVSVGKSSSMAMYQPLNILDVEIVENSKSELWRLRNISAAYPLNGIRSSMGKTSISLFISEVLYRAVQDGADADGLFEWCEHCILTLDALEGDYQNYHLRWLMELIATLGFSPAFEDITPFAEENLREIKDLLGAELPEFMVYPLNGKKRSAIADSLLRYLSVHLEMKLNIKSLAVLGELYSSAK